MLPLFYPISRVGGDDGNRTHDPLLAGQVLSQLSYTPIVWVSFELPLKRSLKIEQQVIGTRYARALSRRLFGFGLLLNYKSSTAQLLRLTFSIERR